MTMQVIQHIELGSAQASITFSSIPQTYTDLCLYVSTRATNDTSLIARFEINGLTTNQSTRYLEGVGSGSGVSSTTGRVDWLNNSSSFTSNTFSSATIYIPNYTSTAVKSFSSDSVAENNATTGLQWIAAGLWNSTAAITELKIIAAANNLAQYSSATLYGITKGSDGQTTVS